MNYVIINGKKSTLIKGLLIQSLPPITKPQMRVKIEEIDGRDGDIITSNGYQSYDKQMSIGLFGDFDIDQVIEYFNQSGQIIFSNEPDKFYTFDQIAQIDFERLARFKTATVTFHVQPFKRSAVDDYFKVSLNRFNLLISDHSHRGIRIQCYGGVIHASGTALTDVEMFVRINPMTLSEGTYTMTAKTSGNGANQCTMRLIEDMPTDAESFGGQAYTLGNDIAQQDTLTEEKTYKYVWLKFLRGETYSFELTMKVWDEDTKSMYILNRGNIYARPNITLHGAGNITVSVNDEQILSIALGNTEWITIDCDEMNAYKDGVLKNRIVSGDYSRLILNVGGNTLSWTGEVREIELQNVSRWL